MAPLGRAAIGRQDRRSLFTLALVGSVLSRVRFVQWVVASGEARSVKVSGLSNPADFNTKHLPTTEFNIYETYVAGHAA